MKKENSTFTAFRSMWLFAMFDLPVDTPKARLDYTRFRQLLLKQGFIMLQYSVYARFCGSEEKAKVIKSRLQKLMPPHGQVRLMGVTDHQFGKMEVYSGKSRFKVEKPPEQLSFF